jgi:superfamily I DNA and RNA helicase
MDIYAREKSFLKGSPVLEMINFLKENASILNLAESFLYHDFPIFKDIDGDVLISEILIVSKQLGITIISVIKEAKGEEELNHGAQQLNELHRILFSRLIRNKKLLASKLALNFNIQLLIYAPNLDKKSMKEVDEIPVSSSLNDVKNFFEGLEAGALGTEEYGELVATIEGAKGLIKPKGRKPVEGDGIKKGNVANEAELEILSFDNYQKTAFMNIIEGPERIRGLAGSGKTVVLAMKAAITHVKYPEAKIAFTFYTKSLYQHVQRLITRFYRQFDDKDPDWNKLKILHAWGNSSNPGIYSEACASVGLRYLTFGEAAEQSKKEPFGYACEKLVALNLVRPLYDYILIDEGQDFPNSFFQLAVNLSREQKIVLAYDELQTIFQPNAPTAIEIFGKNEHGESNVNFSEEVILYKCYRNPNEILTVAHALGFGLYGPRIVQMLEERQYWESLGYQIVSGELQAGSDLEIKRPKENALTTISKYYQIKDIVRAFAYKDYIEEIRETVKLIIADIQDGLLPEDILVIVADDRNAAKYLTDIQHLLARNGINSNNIHADKYNIRDFQVDDHITLSTIHKAKGNESYSVYVVGIDALYSLTPSIRDRNLMFTAMTRAKGWITASGAGDSALAWVKEIEKAKLNFPSLKFRYPSSKELKIMKQDLKSSVSKKIRAEKMLDELLDNMSTDDIERFLKQRSIKKRS